MAREEEEGWKRERERLRREREEVEEREKKALQVACAFPQGSYSMSGTDPGYAAMRYGQSVCDAMSGTDRGHAMRCAVLR
eukprot:410007-Rhodomonas_salina.3